MEHGRPKESAGRNEEVLNPPSLPYATTQHTHAQRVNQGESDGSIKQDDNEIETGEGI